MQISRSGKLGNFSHFRAPDSRVFSLMVNIQQLTRLTGVQEKTALTDELQRVPFRRVMTCGNRNAAMGAMMTDK